MSIPAQLALLNVSNDDVCSAVLVKLNADATLQGANYLTSSGRIAKQNSSSTAQLPRIVVYASTTGIDPTTHWTHFFVDLDIRCRNLTTSGVATKIPDHARFDLVLKRCQVLLIGHGTITKTGFRFFDVISHSIAGPEVSETVPEESSLIARFVVCARAV
jgi:hypothetical protein